MLNDFFSSVFNREDNMENFHRRVTWLQGTAFYEYAGDYPTEVEPHGLAKQCMREYVCIHATVLSDVQKACMDTGRSKPMDIYEKLTLHPIDEAQRPRNLKPVPG